MPITFNTQSKAFPFDVQKLTVGAQAAIFDVLKKQFLPYVNKEVKRRVQKTQDIIQNPVLTLLTHPKPSS